MKSFKKLAAGLLTCAMVATSVGLTPQEEVLADIAKGTGIEASLTEDNKQISFNLGDLGVNVDAVAKATFLFSIPDMSAGYGGAIAVNSGCAGWDAKDFGNQGSGKEIILADLGEGLYSLTRDDLAGKFSSTVGHPQYGIYNEILIQEWWGNGMTVTGVTLYNSNGEVIYQAPEDIKPDKDGFYEVDYKLAHMVNGDVPADGKVSENLGKYAENTSVNSVALLRVATPMNVNSKDPGKSYTGCFGYSYLDSNNEWKWEGIEWSKESLYPYHDLSGCLVRIDLPSSAMDKSGELQNWSEDTDMHITGIKVVPASSLKKINIAEKEGGFIATLIDDAVPGTEIVVVFAAEDGYTVDQSSISVSGAAFEIAKESTGEATAIYFTMPNEDVTVDGNFVASAHAVNCLIGIPGGAVSADVSSAAAGATVTLTNTPEDGYRFVKYNVYNSDDKTVEVPVTGDTFTMPAYDVTVTAEFEKVYTVTLDYDSSKGDASVSVDKAAKGETVKVSLNSTKKLDKITYKYGSNAPVDITSSKSFTMPEGDVTVSVVWSDEEAQKHAVTVETATNGTIATRPMNEAPEGSTVAIIAAPYLNYRVAGITVTTASGAAVRVAGDGNGNYSFDMPKEDVTVRGAFVREYRIIIASDIVGGTVTASKNVALAREIVKLTAVPASGYEFESWNVTAGTNTINVVGGDFIVPEENVRVSATFKKTEVTPEPQKESKTVEVDALPGALDGKTFKAVFADGYNGLDVANLTKADITFTLSGADNGCIGYTDNSDTWKSSNWSSPVSTGTANQYVISGAISGAKAGTNVEFQVWWPENAACTLDKAVFTYKNGTTLTIVKKSGSVTPTPSTDDGRSGKGGSGSSSGSGSGSSSGGSSSGSSSSGSSSSGATYSGSSSSGSTGTAASAKGTDTTVTLSDGTKTSAKVVAKSADGKATLATVGSGDSAVDMIVDASGKAVKNAVTAVGSDSYLTDEEGVVLKTGFYTLDDGRLVYADKNGVLKKGEIFKVGVHRFKALDDCTIVTEDFYRTLLGNTVYANQKGRIVTKQMFTASDGKKYYAYKSGKIVKGREITWKGKTYMCWADGSIK